ncbi:MAG: PhoX family phosphatase [Planctomycetes bacterium]|nr:PhoX family phosphatase [Planctomycetota bacterium]
MTGNEATPLRDENPDGSNPTSNPHLGDLIGRNLSRRSLMGGALAAAAATFLGGGALAARAGAAQPGRSGTPRDGDGSLLGFTEVPASDLDALVVPTGYAASILIPWGTPLFRNAPAFQEDASNTASDQEQQVGFNHDGMHFFPLSKGHEGNRRGLLVVNHEYTDASQIYSAAAGATITPDAAGREKVAKALAGHGVTVVEIEMGRDGGWEHKADSRYNRRVTGTTPMRFSGPVRPDHPLLRSAITPDPRGTLNNCAHGFTPWGTYLACEENWNGYFGTADTNWTPTALESRYGVTRGGFGYNWHVAEPRFDLAVNRNEVNHFGWIVEIDPFDARSAPVKRTALGRIKHEGATVTESRGRVVVYSGDDENGDYLYKFVGNRSWRRLRARGLSPLDHGTLYVAKFAADGTGTWLPLVHGEGPLTAANGWIDPADVLIRTRMAADAVGATRLHRPEWVAVHPRTKEVYVTLTNGTGNTSAVNGNRDPNPYGHIVRFREDRGDHCAQSFQWDVFVLAGDSQYDPRVPATQPVFGSPDGIWVDPDGRLWIQTDISNSSQNRADRGYDRIKNNAMLAADPRTGEVRRFLTGPRGCEITGVITTPDQRTMFVNVQHPGESTTFWDNQFGRPTPANPASVSSWPYGGGRRPRPATVVIRKLDGGRIGT